MTSARRAPEPARGFTLIELMIALAISTVVIAGGMALLLSQQRLYRSSSGVRGVQETARVALGELSSSLRRAGFGVDPAFALDFGASDGAVESQGVPGIDAKSAGYLCADPVLCRDRIDGSDEIVFYARDPHFGHALKSADGGTPSITIGGPLAVPIRKGQVLQVMCMRGQMYWTYVTVAATVEPTAADAVVTLDPGTGEAFPYGHAALSSPAAGVDCLTDGTGWVAKVDRFRYYVANINPAGATVGRNDDGARPYLLLDQGLFDADDKAIVTVIAPDIEDLQLSYVFPRATVVANQVVGGTPGTRISAGADGIALGAGGSGYGVPERDVARTTQHPSNVGAVKISLVVRTPAHDDKIPDATIPAAGNREAMAGPAGYQRARFDTTVALPNLDARAPFFPFHADPTRGERGNVGGS